MVRACRESWVQCWRAGRARESCAACPTSVLGSVLACRLPSLGVPESAPRDVRDSIGKFCQISAGFSVDTPRTPIVPVRACCLAVDHCKIPSSSFEGSRERDFPELLSGDSRTPSMRPLASPARATSKPHLSHRAQAPGREAEHPDSHARASTGTARPHHPRDGRASPLRTPCTSCTAAPLSQPHSPAHPGR
jgi:hypothetical protein